MSSALQTLLIDSYSKFANSRFLQGSALLGISFLLYWPSLLGGPIFDDNQFIFESERFLSAESVWDFWFRSKPQFRSWPLGYSFLFGVYQYAADSFWVYKLLNILIHVSNAFLVSLLAGFFLKPQKSFLIALIFLVHPMQVETISWIFQVNTLLSTFFFLLSCTFLIKAECGGRRLLSVLSIYMFYFSVMAKPIAIVAPAFFLAIFLWKDSLRRWSSILWLVPYFVIAFIGSSETLKGVTHSNPIETEASQLFQEDRQIHTSQIMALDKILPPDPPELSGTNEIEDSVEVSQDIGESPEVLETESAETKSVETEAVEVENVETHVMERKAPDEFAHIEISPPPLESNSDIRERGLNFYEVSFDWGARLARPLFNVSFYLLNFLAPLKPNFIYGKFSKYQKILVTFFGVLALLVGIALQGRDKIFLEAGLAYLCALLPVMGFLYVPYMKFSPVADHWAYLAIAPLAFLLVRLFSQQAVYVRILLVWLVLCSARSHSYSHVFNSGTHILERSLEAAPGELVLYIELSKKYIKSGDLQEAKGLLERGLEQPELADNPFLLMQLGYVYRALGDDLQLKAVLKKLYDRFQGAGRSDLSDRVKKEIEFLEK